MELVVAAGRARLDRGSDLGLGLDLDPDLQRGQGGLWLQYTDCTMLRVEING